MILRAVFFCFLSFLCQLQAQITVSLSATDRTTFISKEQIALKVSINNLSGRELLIHNHGSSSWLGFQVTDREGKNITPVRLETFRPILIPAGKSVSKVIQLSRFYPLSQTGTYHIRASVHLYDKSGRAESYLSNARHINVVHPQTVWNRRYGMPDGSQRSYLLLAATIDKRSRLFVRIDEHVSETTLVCYQLGEYMGFEQPSCIIDPTHHLHVLFQNTPVLYVHSRIAPDGKYLGHQIFRRAATRPTLAQGVQGKVGVLGGLVYDPNAEAAERSRIRNLSEDTGQSFE